jgi:hypothetical protein
LRSEARKALGKCRADGQSRALGSRKAAKGGGKSAGEGLKPGYCLPLLSEATRKALGKRRADGQSGVLGSRKAAKGAGKGAGEGLKPGYGRLSADNQSA